MKRFLGFTLLVVVALCVSSIAFASTNLSLPSEIESYFSVGDSTILDYADLTGHGADDCWFVIIRTKEGTNILYCFKQKENGWDVEFRTSDAVPQVSAPLSMIVDTEGIDYGMNATVEPLLCIYQMNVSNEYPELTLRFALEKRKWNLHSIESYIGYDHMLVQNGVVTFFKSTENLEVAGRVYGTLQRDIRYISLSAIPKTLAEAKKKLTVAPDLPQSAELKVYPVTFSGKKKYDVYSAPDKSSIRGANGKARVSTNSWIQVFGTEGDWVLIQYSIDASHYRFGYITKKSLPKKSEVPELAFRYQSVYTINAVNVTDDPLYSRDTLVTLPAGTEVTLLATLGDDAYIEGNAGKQFRGFAPMTSLSKSASTSDSFTAWNGLVREKAEEIVATKFTSEYGISDYYEDCLDEHGIFRYWTIEQKYRFAGLLPYLIEAENKRLEKYHPEWTNSMPFADSILKWRYGVLQPDYISEESARGKALEFLLNDCGKDCSQDQVSVNLYTGHWKMEQFPAPFWVLSFYNKTRKDAEIWINALTGSMPKNQAVDITHMAEEQFKAYPFEDRLVAGEPVTDDMIDDVTTFYDESLHQWHTLIQVLDSYWEIIIDDETLETVETETSNG